MIRIATIERTIYSPTGEIISGGRLSKYGYEAKEQEQGFGDIPTNGLVSYFALENNALDDSGANNGMIINATRANGKVKDAFYFDGNSDYVQVNDSSSLDLTSSITISAWVMPAKATQGYIAAKYGAYMIQYLGGTTNTTQGGIWIAGTWTTLATSAAIPLNQWTHVVFTYNKSNAVIYINGAQSGTGSSTSSIDVNNNPLVIGAKNSTDRTRDFNGSIDEVGVWNRALSASEVSQLYQHGQQFTSGVRDVDFNARRYSPQLGIFTQPDGVISNVYNPQALNRYMFEEGNPYKNTDPTGHCVWDFCAVEGYGAVVVGAFVGAAVMTAAVVSANLIAEEIRKIPRDTLEKAVIETSKNYLDAQDTANTLNSVVDTARKTYKAYQTGTGEDIQAAKEAGISLSVDVIAGRLLGQYGTSYGAIGYGDATPTNMLVSSYLNIAYSNKVSQLKAGDSYSTRRGVQTKVSSKVGSNIIISKSHQSSYANVRTALASKNKT